MKKRIMLETFDYADRETGRLYPDGSRVTYAFVAAGPHRRFSDAMHRV